MDAYLRSLPADRRAEISTVREVILRNMDAAYEEGIQYGMIGYYVPLSAYPKGYHANPKQPLTFATLGSQKNYMSLYLMCAYGGEQAQWFREEWAKTGKKIDMGKSCIRFKKADDLPLELIGEAVKRVPAKKWIAICEAAQAKKTAPAKKKRAASSK